MDIKRHWKISGILSARIPIAGFLLLLVSVAGFVLPADSKAAYRQRSDFFMKPQVGVWFGPCAPMGALRDSVDTTLGGGAFVRRNTVWSPLKLGADISYQKHESGGINSLALMPIYGNALFHLPIKFPINFQLKLGAGGVNVHTKPDDKSQFDPLFMTGLEASFPAGRIMNFGMRFDYMVIYEKHYAGAKMNGYIFNVGLTLFFNL